MTDYTAQIAALRAALASGVRVAQKGDERIEYRTMDEMRDELARLEAAQAGRSRKSRLRQMTPRCSRGL